MDSRSLHNRLTVTAILLLVAGIGVTGWPFEIDVWGINQQISLALALAIPLSIIWAGFASLRHDVRWAAEHRTILYERGEGQSRVPYGLLTEPVVI